MTNAVDTKHPLWTARAPEWTLMRDTAGGENEVKAAGITYLPQPSGFKAQADGGRALYDAYQTRAQFPEIVLPTIHGMLGVIHRTEAQIEMPDAMKPLWEKATKDGLPLEALHRRITAELLTTGRYALLADAATEGSDLPWLAGYSAESLINWSDDRTMFVLDESGLRRDGFRWEQEQRFRVLEMKEGSYTVQTFTGTERTPGDEVIPAGRGNAKLTEIPFVVIGARDLSLAPELPPLLGVARSAIALYQLSADYRWQLFMTGQETLVVINGDAPSAVGAGAVIAIKQGDNAGTPDVKYVGPAGTGIDAHRIAILDERQNAAQSGARLFNSAETKTAESGDALRIRFAAETATLTSIAQASAQGLEKALRHIAVMIGQSPDAVTVKPNLSFIDSTLTPEQAASLVSLWQNGAIAYETLYENLQRGEIASAERDHEAELKLIDDERFGSESERQAAVG
ncbi:DUF4055 domain-containing protein [Sinorhizobium medicae]|nr:DUF4055 domain-containing protein [Sinorhizobium meliloti]MDX0182546.1 DUF4055 domain-containing protein [Sinorhizobium meliloti]MDX0408869.1 DUF4055 domain-containing protein [Sinorhizobium medicae]MDX0420836.1 DUF4055 domain-containing protein [Sinorhizobium medicae]MDX1035262.1 DUF4055 domain-containing protein [Sinorhizobium medicae]